ncbi:MAG: class I SAM-dependent methyltransferase [Phycisphaerales bacterium]
MPHHMARTVREHRQRLYSEGAAPGESGAKTPLWPAGLTKGAGDFLRDLVVREGALSTVEVGLGLGLSSLAILEGLLSVPGAKRRHVTIDPGQEWCDRAGVRTVQESGAASITTIIEKPSAMALARLWEEGQVFDFAFIDGAHWFDAVLVDLCLARRVVKHGGLIVLDDHWMPSIQAVLAFATTNLGFALELFDAGSPGGRMVAVRNGLAPDLRAWDHFKAFSRADLPDYPWRKQPAPVADSA